KGLLGSRNRPMLGRKLIGRKVVSKDRKVVGKVEEIIFDFSSGKLLGLKVREENERILIPMEDVRLNVYTNDFMLSYTSDMIKRK
ncbi:MAG: PRC-barrel domain-containing protein, partial [Candidatus Syntropharchaeia archaeon]